MNVNKILERNRFTALCGGCGEIFHYSTIEEVIFAHQGGPNCETPCQSCTTGVLCACEYCQSLITDKLNDYDLSDQSVEIDQMFTQLEKNAAAPVQVVPTPLESSRPNADKLHYRHQPVINSVFKIPYSPDADWKTLCQDCLRVVCHPTKQAMDMAHDEFFFCDCGGQLCAWSDCSDLATFVARNGSSAIVEFARLGAIKPITGPFIYSPATGIVREQSK